MNAITLDQLTPEQIAALSKQMKQATTAKRKSAGNRWAVVDPMLKSKDANGFKHTTADIVAELQSKALLPKDLNAADRAEALKMVQTRKQKLAKLRDKDGKLVHAEGSIGFKQSANGLVLTVERCIEFLNQHGYKIAKK